MMGALIALVAIVLLLALASALEDVIRFFRR